VVRQSSKRQNLSGREAQLLGSQHLSQPSRTQEYIVFGRKRATERLSGGRDTESNFSITGPQRQYAGPRKPCKGALQRRTYKESGRMRVLGTSAPSTTDFSAYTARSSATKLHPDEFEPRRFSSQSSRQAEQMLQDESRSKTASTGPWGWQNDANNISTAEGLDVTRATAASSERMRHKYDLSANALPMRYTTHADLLQGKDLERGGWMGAYSVASSMSQTVPNAPRSEKATRAFATGNEMGSMHPAPQSWGVEVSQVPVRRATSAAMSNETPRNYGTSATEELASTFAPSATEYHVSSGYLVSRQALCQLQDTSSMPVFGKPSSTALPSTIQRLIQPAVAVSRAVPRHLESSVGLIMGSDYRMKSPIVRVPTDIKQRIDVDRGTKPIMRCSGTHNLTSFDNCDVRPQKRTASQIILQQSPFLQQGVAAGRPSSASKKHTSMLEADAFWMRSEPVQYESL